MYATMGSLSIPTHTKDRLVTQLNDGESAGPKEVMNETYDKSLPVHDPTPRPDEPREIFPYQIAGQVKDFRPINEIDYPEVKLDKEVLETGEVEPEEEVDPKDSSVPESAPSSISEPTPANELSESSSTTVPVEKDNGQPKEPESGSPTSSLPPMIGEVELPVSTQPQGEESLIPGSPAKQN